MKKTWIAYLLWLPPLGIFGIHKYYLGRIGEGIRIILKNAYSSSDNKYFYYAQDYRLLSMDKDFRSVDWDRSLYLVK